MILCMTVGGRMSIFRIVLLLMFFSLFVVPGSRAEAPPGTGYPANINGNDWVNWPEQTRLIVLYGIVNGMNMVIYSMSSDSEAMSEFDASSSDSKFRDKVNKYIVKDVTTAQLYKGINEIYADEEERGIALSDVVYFVVKWIHGCGEDEFNRVLKYIKQKHIPGAIENLIVRRDDGLVLKIYEFP